MAITDFFNPDNAPGLAEKYVFVLDNMPATGEYVEGTFFYYKPTGVRYRVDSSGVPQALAGGTSDVHVVTTATPLAGDDSDSGYEVGATWWNTNNGKFYTLLDSTPGAAVWEQVNSVASIAWTDVTGKPTIGTGAALDAPGVGDDADTGEVVRGDDTRLTDARAPTAHQSTHHYTTGSDPIRAFDVRAVPWASGSRPPTDTDDSGDDLTAGAIWGDFTSYPVELWVLVDERPLQAVWKRLMTEATVFDGTNNGVVDAPVSVTGLFLRDDGSWAAAPEFSAGSAGAVASPDGGGADAAKFLRGDNTWQDVLTSDHLNVTTTAPTVDDDSNAGYAPGFLWVNTTTGVGYILTDATVGAAVWATVTGVAAGGFTRSSAGTIGGSTYNPTLVDATVTELTCSQNLTITLDSNVSGSDIYESELWVNAQGFAVDFANGDVTSSVAISTTAGEITKLFIRHYYDSDAGAPAFEIYQYFIKASSVTLPQTNLVALYEFTSDAADSKNSFDLTLQGSASVIGTGDGGLNLASATSDAALRTADSPLDMDSDWTIYVAFKWDQSTPGGDMAVFAFCSDTTGQPYVYFYISSTGTMRCSSRNTAGAGGTAASVSLASTPDGIQLWEIRNNGGTLDITCLNNSAAGSGSLPAATIDVDNFSVGARYPNSGYDRGWNGGATNPIYALALYQAAVTSSTTRDQIKTWFTSDRGLTLA